MRNVSEKGSEIGDEILIPIVLESLKNTGVDEAGNQKGWILIDFPRTTAQAMRLEKELSGYLVFILLTSS